jgi:iron complex outermembrane recepter protein
LNYAYQTSGGWAVSDQFTPRTGTITTKPPTVTTSAVLQDKGLRKNSDTKSNDFWAKFGVEPNQNSQYYINFHYLNRERGMPPSLDTVTVFTSRPAFSQFWRTPKFEDWGVDLNAKQKIAEPLTLRATLFYHHHMDDLASYLDRDYLTQLALSRYQDYAVGGTFIIEYQPIKSDILRASASYRGDSHEDRDDEYLPFAKKFSYTGSVGLENEYKPMDNLAIVAGASYDWFDVCEAYKNVTDGSGNFLRQDAFNTPRMNSFNPMGGITYTFADATKLYASVAKKTRFPTLFNLYTSKGGNPDLQAEKGINYTLGVKRPFSNYALAEVVLFYYDLSDMIVRSGPLNTDPLLNIASVRYMGLELKGELYPVDSVTVGADFTYNNASDRSDRRVTDDITNVPKYKADAWIRYVVSYLNLKTRIELTGTYVGRTFSQLPTLSSPSSAVLETSDYFLFNAKVTQPFLKYFEIYVACNNIGDKSYEPESGFPGQGRTFWTGVSAKF